MKEWQKRLLQAAGFGAGATVAIFVVFGAVALYRAHRATIWDRAAITTKFAELTVNYGTPQFTVNLAYSITNNTAHDYAIPTDKSQLFLVSPVGGSLYRFTSGPDPYAADVIIDNGGYVPAGRSVLVNVHLKYEYNQDYPAEDSGDAAKMSPYVGHRLERIDGLVIFDKASQYEIDFSNGWKDDVKKLLAPKKQAVSPSVK